MDGELDENGMVIITNVYGDVCIRKARRKRQKLLVKELMFEYANNTTLHGLPYVTRNGLTRTEKVFWLIMFLTSMCMCLFLISKVWLKWQTSPVIVTVSEQLVPVSMVPFPSVTICPQTKCKLSAYNYTDMNIKLDKVLDDTGRLNLTVLNKTIIDEGIKFYQISQVCEGLDFSYYLSEEYRYTDSSIVDHLLEIAPNYTDVFFYCKLNGKLIQCTEMFDQVVTGEGICYTMNSLAASDIFRYTRLQRDYAYLNSSKKIHGWSPEHGYSYESPDNYSKSFYPMPGMPNRASPDVEVVLKEYHDRDQLCNALRSGFKVFVHHPMDLPQSSLYYYAVLNSQTSSMALSFSILNSSESLRSYGAVVRQCYFPDERYLKYFKIYTASNCMIECLSNITYEHCGCVKFYMPHSSSKRICTQYDAECIQDATDKMLRRESSQEDYVCHCLPSCNSVDYDAEILKTEFNLQKLIGTLDKIYTFRNKKELESYNYSKLEIYFKKPRFLSMRRNELFGIIDFLANCGGLLGLFLGFSFLSLMEIFYFVTLRLCCTLKKDLEEERREKQRRQEIHVKKY